MHILFVAYTWSVWFGGTYYGLADLFIHMFLNRCQILHKYPRCAQLMTPRFPNQILDEMIAFYSIIILLSWILIKQDHIRNQQLWHKHEYARPSCATGECPGHPGPGQPELHSSGWVCVEAWPKLQVGTPRLPKGPKLHFLHPLSRLTSLVSRYCISLLVIMCDILIFFFKSFWIS